VYCGSRPGTDPAFAENRREVGHWIGRHGGQLVYGGGNNGLMGVVADATLAAGGRVVGIIPKALVDREWAQADCTELHVVDTMHERKRLMAERADAFLALPGGIGTFEELFEVWTWRQLGYHDKPVGLLNAGGLLRQPAGLPAQQRAAGLHGDWQMDLLHTGSDPRNCCRPGAGGRALTANRVNLSDLGLRRPIRPVSPVRMRTTRSTVVTKILPSPILPVRAALTMASTQRSTSSSSPPPRPSPWAGSPPRTRRRGTARCGPSGGQSP
jgi:uncharacterized protein (TIGR00730 family)